MYEHLKKRVTGLFGYEVLSHHLNKKVSIHVDIFIIDLFVHDYQEEKDENSFLMSVDETLSDVTLPEDRVAL